MSDIATTINAIRRVAAAATQYTEILVPEWLPEGKRQACEWSCRNPTRADRHAGSFSVSLLDGRWHDFATGDAEAILYHWGRTSGTYAKSMPLALWLTGWASVCPHCVSPIL